MDFVLDPRPAPQERWARPGPASSPRAEKCGRPGVCGPLSLSPSLSLHSSCLSPSLLPPQGPGGPGAWAAATQRSVQVQQVQAQQVQAPPRTRLPPPPPSFHAPPSPTFLCWLLHLCLTLGFRVLTTHSALFLSSSLSSPRRRPAEGGGRVLSGLLGPSLSSVILLALQANLGMTALPGD